MLSIGSRESNSDWSQMLRVKGVMEHPQTLNHTRIEPRVPNPYCHAVGLTLTSIYIYISAL